MKKWWLLSSIVFLVAVASADLGKGEERLTGDTFARLHKLIKPQSGESRWAQIPWFTSIVEARKTAATMGKPILIWSGGGSAPLGGC